MTNLVNKIIAYFWTLKHIRRAYYKYCKEMRKDPHYIKEYPIGEIPTVALEKYLLSVDGVKMTAMKLEFTNMCKRELEFRERIALVEHGV